ncbi:MAG: serine--tRNA ligase, partial [Gemmatimonadota bacterium]|nr:serine--tRNA ligase [Gemmatimonadota bacterium]
MIDLRQLRQDPAGVRAALSRRRDPSLLALLDQLDDLDRQRREVLTRVEALKAERNIASEEVARRKKAGQPADDLLVTLKRSSDEVKGLDVRVREIESELDALALTVPNLPLA